MSSITSLVTSIMTAQIFSENSCSYTRYVWPKSNEMIATDSGDDGHGVDDEDGTDGNSLIHSPQKEVSAMRVLRAGNDDADDDHGGDVLIKGLMVMLAERARRPVKGGGLTVAVAVFVISVY